MEFVVAAAIAIAVMLKIINSMFGFALENESLHVESGATLKVDGNVSGCENSQNQTHAKHVFGYSQFRVLRHIGSRSYSLELQDGCTAETYWT